MLGMAEEAKSYAHRPIPVFEVWAENQVIVDVFVSMDTQWRFAVGMASISYIGLDYSALRATVELMGLRRTQWADVFTGIRVMEAEALKIFREKASRG